MRSLSKRSFISVRVVGFALAVACGLLPAEAQPPLIAVPPEPTQAELLQAAGVDPDDPDALSMKLYLLLRRSPGAVDEWIPRLREVERDELGDQYIKLTKSVPEEHRPVILRSLEADLKQRRPHDAARQVDAILRRLGAVGRAEHFGVAGAKSSARTPWGRSKAAAAMLEIAARHGPAIRPTRHDYAYLIRELEPAQAGAIAAESLDRLEESSRHPNAGHKIHLELRLWLAVALSGTNPERALRTLAPGLESRDPMLRLFAGLAISRLGDGRIPFRLTAPPDETRQAREAWLAQLKPHKPAAFAFEDPLDAPVVQTQRGGRVDLVWLDENAAITRRQADVWPLVRHVLPDGTFFSRLLSFDYYTMALALTSPEGETYARFDGECRDSSPQRGTFWCAAPGGHQIAEYAPWGEALWALPINANMAAPAGPGRVLVVRSPVQIVDRRGDVIWTVQTMKGPRWATMIDADTVLFSCKNEIEIHHRTSGLLRTVGGFKSLGWVRYHPERPWMIWDGGDSSVVIFDPKTEKRAARKIGWVNDDHPTRSRYLRVNEQWPD
jgi:hypothetical protein